MNSFVVGLLIGILSTVIVAVIGLIVMYAKTERDIKRLEQQFNVTLSQELEKRNKTQRATVKGQLAEQLYPIMPSCPYLPSDMRFIGHPIDYIIFDGYTETKDGEGEIREIIFADIKTGKSSLSKHQRAIRDAVVAGRVRWQVMREE